MITVCKGVVANVITFVLEYYSSNRVINNDHMIKVLPFNSVVIAHHELLIFCGLEKNSFYLLWDSKAHF